MIACFFCCFSSLRGREGQLPFISKLLDTQESLEAGNWTLLQAALNDLDLSDLPLPKESHSMVTSVTCELDEPKTRSDNPKKFTAGLAVCLPVRGILQNLAEDSQLYVKVSVSITVVMIVVAATH